MATLEVILPSFKPEKRYTLAKIDTSRCARIQLRHGDSWLRKAGVSKVYETNITLGQHSHTWLPVLSVRPTSDKNPSAEQNNIEASGVLPWFVRPSTRAILSGA